MIRTHSHTATKDDVALDEFDARMIRAFETDGRIIGRDLSSIVGLSEATISRRLGVLEESSALRVCGYIDPWQVGCACVAQLRLAVTGDPAKVAAGIAGRMRCFRLGCMAGTGELVALLATASSRELLGEIDEIIAGNPGVSITVVDPVMAMHIGRDPANQPATQPASAQLRNAPRQRQTDMRLLRVLQRNMRVSYTRIAKDLDLSISVAGDHTRRLIATGAITPVAVYDRALLGNGLSAIVHIAAKRDIAATAAAIAASFRTNLVMVTGHVDQISVEVSLANEGELHAWTDQVRKLPAVTRVRWEAIGTVYKEAYDWAVLEADESVTEHA